MFTALAAVAAVAREERIIQAVAVVVAVRTPDKISQGSRQEVVSVLKSARRVAEVLLVVLPERRVQILGLTVPL